MLEYVQPALDQSQQLQALTESRHQAEQQQLAETPSEEPGVTNSILTQHIEIRSWRTYLPESRGCGGKLRVGYQPCWPKTRPATPGMSLCLAQAGS